MFFPMKTTLFILISLLSFRVIAQSDSAQVMTEILAWQEELNSDYKNPDKSPLEPDDFKTFESHPFYPIDLKYRVKAKLTMMTGTPFFKMKTTTTRLPVYRIYGIAEFTLDGKEFQIPVYQSQELMKKIEYADYLFFPFTDLTNGKGTYQNGRYISLHIPKPGEDLVIDFNQAYNPYCAYNPNYSCPIVPEENYMDIEIPVGIRYQEHH